MNKTITKIINKEKNIDIVADIFLFLGFLISSKILSSFSFISITFNDNF